MTTLLAVIEGRMRDETSSVHLTSDRVAAFLDSRLTGAERDVLWGLTAVILSLFVVVEAKTMMVNLGAAMHDAYCQDH